MIRFNPEVFGKRSEFRKLIEAAKIAGKAAKNPKVAAYRYLCGRLGVKPKLKPPDIVAMHDKAWTNYPMLSYILPVRPGSQTSTRLSKAQIGHLTDYIVTCERKRLCHVDWGTSTPSTQTS